MQMQDVVLGVIFLAAKVLLHLVQRTVGKFCGLLVEVSFSEYFSEHLLMKISIHQIFLERA